MQTMNHADAVDLLKRLIAVPSPSREEAAAADIVEAEFRRRGFAPRRKGNNVWAEAAEHDPHKPTLLLDAHIDTVKPNPSWTRDPFAPVEDGGRLYGLGSNDTGGSLVSLMTVFTQLAATEQPYNLLCLASAEEEVTGAGGVRAVLEDLGRIDFAVVGEPTGMRPAVAEKGLLVLDCTAHGRAGHAARDEGDNAIYKAMADMEWFRDYRFDRVSPLLGPVKMTVTCVQAGTQHNVIPAECRFTVDIRVNECYTNTEILDEVRRHISCNVVPRSTHLNSSSIPVSHPAVRRLAAMGRSPFGSPTLSNQAVMPFATLKIGPGDSARSHTADEYILTDKIAEAIAVYRTMLDGLDLTE